MRPVDPTVVIEANYTLYQLCDGIEHLDAYDELMVLFEQYKSAFNGECKIPYYWAPVVSEAVRKMVKADPKVAFINIKEENAKLFLDVWYPSTSGEIRDIVHQAKNAIDQLIHDRVRKILLQRKFHYVPEGFHQLIPPQHR